MIEPAENRARHVERLLWAHRRAACSYRRCAAREREARRWQRLRTLITLRRLAFEAECRALLRELLRLRRENRPC